MRVEYSVKKYIDEDFITTMKEEKVEMSKEDIEELANIIKELNCPKNLQCCQTGFEKVCCVRLREPEGVFECMDESPADCKFAVSHYDQFFICQCPLRKYIAGKFKKTGNEI